MSGSMVLRLTITCRTARFPCGAAAPRGDAVIGQHVGGAERRGALHVEIEDAAEIRLRLGGQLQSAHIAVLRAETQPDRQFRPCLDEARQLDQPGLARLHRIRQRFGPAGLLKQQAKSRPFHRKHQPARMSIPQRKRPARKHLPKLSPPPAQKTMNSCRRLGFHDVNALLVPRRVRPKSDPFHNATLRLRSVRHGYR